MTMSRSFVLAAAVLALTAERGFGQVFQGSVTFKMTMEGQSMETKYYSNGKRARSEMSMGGRQMISIIDYAEAKSYTLLPDQKKYLMMDMNAMADLAKGMGEAMGDKNPKNPKNPDLSKLPKITVTPTGQKETIAGYSCEHYTVQSEKTDMDFCVAKGLGNYSMPGGGGMGGMGGSGVLAALAANPGYKQLVDMAKEGFFPLKFTMSQGGSVKLTSEATEVKKGAVSPDLLAIPSDYTEIKMPGFGPKRP
jgi:hypothetical protein